MVLRRRGRQRGGFSGYKTREMTCLVLSTCYAQLQKHYFPPSRPASCKPCDDFIEYSELLPAWEDINAAVIREAPPLSTQRLRAFFALELSCYRLISCQPRALDKVDLKKLFQVQRSRDHAGLTALIGVCKEAMSTLSMRIGHTELLGRECNPALPLIISSLRGAGKRVELCQEMAEALRSALDGNDANLERVGRRFAELVITSNTPLEKGVEYMRLLLSISLTNPLSPWNP